MSKVRRLSWPRRRALTALLGGAFALLHPGLAGAFGEEGAFHVRLLVTNNEDQTEALSAARRWAWEVTRRTSAPGRLAAQTVRPESSKLLEEPFIVWAGVRDPGRLDSRAMRNLRKYLRMGGIIVVDDRVPAAGDFGKGVRRELRRVLPQSGVVRLAPEHVLFKTFYILDGPRGRVQGPEFVEAIVRGKSAQVLFLNHDLLGALSRKGDTWAFPMGAGGSEARERAVRFVVNIAMYVLCSDYKDDQVHAPFLMRRRHKRR